MYDLKPVVLGRVAGHHADPEVLTGSCVGFDYCDMTLDWAKYGSEEDPEDDRCGDDT